MPLEVISLLSSSDTGSPPPQVARLPSAPRGSALEAWALDSDDLFAPELSSSLVENAAPLQSTPSLGAVDDVWLVSDNESEPEQYGAQSASAFVDGPASKRRRLDHSPGTRPLPAAHAAVSCRPRPVQTELPRPGAERPTARINWLERDPFASSSPRATESVRSGMERRRPGLSSMVSADEPLGGPVKWQDRGVPTGTGTRLLGLDDIDPFASSSPGPMPHRAKAAPVSAASWDPISSSAPLPTASDDKPLNPLQSTGPFRRTQSELIIVVGSDEGEPVAQPGSDDDFPDISDLATSKPGPPSPLALPAPTIRSKPPKKPRPAVKKMASADPKDALEKAKDKEEKAAAREAEKERKRLEKERAKEERAYEKAQAAALAEVNKIRTDKNVSTSEMIVDLPITLDEAVKLQAQTLLRDLQVHSTSWPSPVENVIKWRRKVTSRFSEDLGHWEPIPERVERENYAMAIIPASRFVDLVLGDEVASLESHVLRMKQHFPDNTIIYMIEGLELWQRKNRNVRNRQFVSAVRSGLEPAQAPELPPPSSQPTANPKPRNRSSKVTTAAPPTYIDEETIENALLQLQVLHGVLIHHTSIPLETARWIAVFTQHISTAPYRRQRDAANDAAFCMEAGQVRTGDGPRDTYVRLLQEIGRVTAPIAYGVAAEFGSVPALVRGLETRGPLALENVRKSVNKEGEAGDRAVGQAVSRRVYKIFTGRDGSSTDI